MNDISEKFLSEEHRVENVVAMEMRGELNNLRFGRRNLAGILAREIINQRTRERKLYQEIAALKREREGYFLSIFSF